MTTTRAPDLSPALGLSRGPDLPRGEGPPALLHIGCIKTGTTFLQNEVFSNPACGFALAGGAQNRALLVDHLIASDGFSFDPAATADVFRQAEAAVPTGCLPVWSDETLLGNPLPRRYHGPEVLRRLKATGRRYKVLITIREQKSFAYSAFTEYQKRSPHPLTDFIGTGAETLSFRPILTREFLEYDRAVRAWQQGFGRENVLVLPYEMLRRDFAGFVRRLTEFAGSTGTLQPGNTVHNKGQGAAAMALQRRFNRLILRSPLNQTRSGGERVLGKLTKAVDRLAPRSLDKTIEARWRAEIAARYAGAFAEPNRRLEALTGLDLRALGYD